MTSLVLCACLFSVTLAACLAQNLFEADARTTLAFDSRHYLESCRQMVLMWRDLWLNGPSAVHADPWFTDYLLLDGPLLPMVGAFAFIVAGRLPAQTEWQVFVVLQGVLHALSSVLVWLVARQLTHSKRWATASALCWAFYPAAILAAGRYLTETLATVLLLSLVLTLSAIVSGRRRSLWTIVAGFIDGLLFIFKPALLVGWLAATLLSIALLCGWRLRLKSIVLLVCGFALVLVPWLSTTKALTGRFYLIPQREPVHNMAKGCDTEIDGWSAMPDPPLTRQYAAMESPLSVLRVASVSHPGELLQLALRKPERMLSWPWNDFRRTIFFVSPQIQQWMQSLLCALSLFGVFALLCQRRRPLLSDGSGPEPGFIGLAAIAIILGHCAYIPFEAITRYGFTSMPFVIVFAVYLFYWLERKRMTASFLTSPGLCAVVFVALVNAPAIPLLVACCGSFEKAMSVYAAACAAAFSCVCVATWLFFRRAEPGSRSDRLFVSALVLFMIGGFAMLAAQLAFSRDYAEWSSVLGPGQSCTRTIALKAERGIPQAAFLLLDSSSEAAQARITVNGCPLAVRADSLNRYSPLHYPLFNLLGTYAGYMGTTADNMRQWRLAPVDLRCVRLDGDNLVTVTAGTGAALTIYGDYTSDQSRHHAVPSFDYFSAGRFCNSEKGLESRVYEGAGWPLARSHSSLGDGGLDLSSAPGLQQGEYRIFLVLGYKSGTGHAADGVVSPPVAQNFSRAIDADDFDEQMRRDFQGERIVQVNRAVLRHARSTASRVEIPLQLGQSDFVRVDISGELRSQKGNGRAGVLCVLEGGANTSFSMVLPSTPPYFLCSPQWCKFALGEIVPTRALPGRLGGIQIGLYPGPWRDVSEYGPVKPASDFMVRNLKVSVQAVQRPDIDGLKLLVF